MQADISGVDSPTPHPTPCRQKDDGCRIDSASCCCLSSTYHQFFSRSGNPSTMHPSTPLAEGLLSSHTPSATPAATSALDAARSASFATAAVAHCYDGLLDAFPLRDRLTIRESTPKQERDKARARMGIRNLGKTQTSMKSRTFNTFRCIALCWVPHSY
jgi:hypothetical protein